MSGTVSQSFSDVAYGGLLFSNVTVAETDVGMTVPFLSFTDETGYGGTTSGNYIALQWAGFGALVFAAGSTITLTISYDVATAGRVDIAGLQQSFTFDLFSSNLGGFTGLTLNAVETVTSPANVVVGQSTTTLQNPAYPPTRPGDTDLAGRWDSLHVEMQVTVAVGRELDDWSYLGFSQIQQGFKLAEDAGPDVAVAISGIAEAGQVLTATPTVADSANNLGTTALRWQYSADGETWSDIAGATGATYTLRPFEDLGHVRAVATYTDRWGNTFDAASPGSSRLVVEDILGTYEVGSTVTGVVSVQDADNPAAMAAVTLQWQRDVDGTWTDIAGATGLDYTLTRADTGGVRLVARYLDADARSQVLHSDNLAISVSGNIEPPAVAVTIVGVARECETLAAEAVVDTHGEPVAGTLSYQWRISEDGGATWTDIPGATGATYRLQAGDVGRQIQVVATYTAETGGACAADSAATVPVAGVPTPAPVVELADDSGALKTDGITNDRTLRGTAAAHATVVLTEDGLVLGTATADEDGDWSFTPPALADGAHTIVATETAGCKIGTDTLAFTLDTATDVEAVLAQARTGCDGTPVTSSPVLTSGGTTLRDAGATLVFREGTTVLGTATTGADGSWRFDLAGLPLGTHTITVTQTDLAGNIDVDTLTFKVVAPSAAVTGTVWADTDADGVRDGCEQGLGCVVVKLLDAAGTQVLATTRTNAAGTYTFSGLLPGVYQVQVVAPTGDVFSPLVVGGTGTVTSDVNQATGMSGPLTVLDGTTARIDAGVHMVYGPGTLGAPLSAQALAGLNGAGASYGPSASGHFADGPYTVASGTAAALYTGPGANKADTLLLVVSLTEAGLCALGDGVVTLNYGAGTVTLSTANFFTSAEAGFPSKISGLGNGKVNGIAFTTALHAAVAIDYGALLGTFGGTDSLLGYVTINSPVGLRVDVFGVRDGVIVSNAANSGAEGVARAGGCAPEIESCAPVIAFADRCGSGHEDLRSIDSATVRPFAAIDLDDGAGGCGEGGTVSVRITLTDANGGATDANGTLSGTGLTKVGVGTYTLSGTERVVTGWMRDLVFTPTDNQVAPGRTVTTWFDVAASNGAGWTSADATTRLTVTATNSAPVLEQPVLTCTLAEGDTLRDLWARVLANATDLDAGDQARLTISAIGQSGTAGFLNFDPAAGLLTYTAGGYDPGRPADSFTYTIRDAQGASVTGTVRIAVTGEGLPTTVGTNCGDTRTLSVSNARLVALAGDDRLTVTGSGNQVFAGAGDDTITVTGRNNTIHTGAGSDRIAIGGSGTTIVLSEGGTDTITGATLGNGTALDLRTVLAQSGIDLAGDLTRVSDYFSVSRSGSNVSLRFDPSEGCGGAGTVAVLSGLGRNVTLATLIDNDMLRV